MVLSSLCVQPFLALMLLRGVKLYLVSIGTHERSKMFVEVTDFPSENLFVVSCLRTATFWWAVEHVNLSGPYQT